MPSAQYLFFPRTRPRPQMWALDIKRIPSEHEARSRILGLRVRCGDIIVSGWPCAAVYPTVGLQDVVRVFRPGQERERTGNRLFLGAVRRVRNERWDYQNVGAYGSRDDRAQGAQARKIRGR